MKHYPLKSGDYAAHMDREALYKWAKSEITPEECMVRIENNNGFRFDSLTSFLEWSKALGWIRQALGYTPDEKEWDERD